MTLKPINLFKLTSLVGLSLRIPIGVIRTRRHAGRGGHLARRLMRNMVLYTTLFMVISGNSVAGQFWSDDKATNIAIITANALDVLDWAQTRYIADHPNTFYERGLCEHYAGEHPSSGDVNRCFATLIAVNNLIGYFLPEKSTIFGFELSPKKAFYFTSSALSANTVRSNNEIGIRIQF